MAFVTFGEIMLRLTPSAHSEKINSCHSFRANYAGSESNVASSLAVLENETKFITKLPDNQLGDAAINSLRKYGINTSQITRGGAKIGTYFIEIGSSIRPSSVIYDRKGSSISLIEENEFDWETIFTNQKWLYISGITSALSPQCAMETIKVVKIAKKMGVKVSFDMNYRRTLWKNARDARKIFDQILEHTDLLFGNIGVLKDIYDMDFKGTSQPEKTLAAAHKSQRQFEIENIAFTVRNHTSASKNELSALCLHGRDSPIISNTYNVEILDRFGTGDAFAAAYLHSIISNWDTQRTINFATAAFALKHTIQGDQHTSNEQEICSIMEGNTSGYVLR